MHSFLRCCYSFLLYCIMSVLFVLFVCLYFCMYLLHSFLFTYACLSVFGSFFFIYVYVCICVCSFILYCLFVIPFALTCSLFLSVFLSLTRRSTWLHKRLYFCLIYLRILNIILALIQLHALRQCLRVRLCLLLLLRCITVATDTFTDSYTYDI